MGEETRIERQKRGKLTNTDADLGLDIHGTVGQVLNEERRAFKQEPRFEGGVNREDVGQRFQAIDSTPTRGVTAEKGEQPTSGGVIGKVPDPSARTYGSRIEPAFVGLERRIGGELNSRFFGQGETIPREGVTVPSTPSPTISEPALTSPPRKQDLRDLEGPNVGPTGANPASIYHEAIQEREKEVHGKGELQGTSTQGSGPNPAFRRKQGRPIEDRGEDE